MTRCHSKPVADFTKFLPQDYIARSALGYAPVYNPLPERIVQATCQAVPMPSATPGHLKGCERRRRLALHTVIARVAQHASAAILWVTPLSGGVSV